MEDTVQLDFKEFIWAFEGRCVSCKFWNGDRQAEHRSFLRSNGVSMDFERGWSAGGTCQVDHHFLDKDIRGDASVSILFNANFGCIHWTEYEV